MQRSSTSSKSLTPAEGKSQKETKRSDLPDFLSVSKFFGAMEQYRENISLFDDYDKKCQENDRKPDPDFVEKIKADVLKLADIFENIIDKIQDVSHCIDSAKAICEEFNKRMQDETIYYKHAQVPRFNLPVFMEAYNEYSNGLAGDSDDENELDQLPNENENKEYESDQDNADSFFEVTQETKSVIKPLSTPTNTAPQSVENNSASRPKLIISRPTPASQRTVIRQSLAKLSIAKVKDEYQERIIQSATDDEALDVIKNEMKDSLLDSEVVEGFAARVLDRHNKGLERKESSQAVRRSLSFVATPGGLTRQRSKSLPGDSSTPTLCRASSRRMSQSRIPNSIPSPSPLPLPSPSPRFDDDANSNFAFVDLAPNTISDLALPTVPFNSALNIFSSERNKRNSPSFSSSDGLELDNESFSKIGLSDSEVSSSSMLNSRK